MPARDASVIGARVQHVWYFAYGSNMSSGTLRGRRGVEYRRAIPARVKGWRLVFDKPPLIPIKEGYANIVADPASSVIGVLFEVSLDDLDHIELTEGVRIDNYRRIEVEADALGGDGGSRRAFSLSSTKRDPALRPSSRYMDLLIAGAQEHGLPAEYVTYLRSLPACEEDPAASQFREVIEQALRRR